MWVVYCIERDDGQLYIGKTSRERLLIRMQQHKRSSIFKDHDFKYEILEEHENHNIILQLETSHIKRLDTYEHGLNRTPTGKGFGHSSPNFTTSGYISVKKVERK